MTSIRLLFICCVIGSALARTEADIKKMFIQQALDCSKEVAVTGEDIKMIKEHKIPNNNGAKCLVACTLKRMDWIDDKGMFNANNAYKLSEKEYGDDKVKLDNAKKLYEACKKVNEESIDNDKDGCERSALLATCLIEQAPKMGFGLQ